MTETDTRTDVDATESTENSLDIGLAAVYRTLGTLYREPPEPETIEAIEQWGSFVGADPELPEELSAAIETILEAETDLEVLKPAFTRLFLGVGEQYSPPPPYESLYVDGTLNGPTSTEVEAFYLDSGFELAVDGDLVDHAAFELAFLAGLCEHGSQRRQLAFIELHLGEWLPEFHERATEFEVPAFYQGVFDLTEAVMDLHIESLREEGVSID